MPIEFLNQKEVNDCILASVANYVHLNAGPPAVSVYEELLELIQNSAVLAAQDYQAWKEGHGVPLELISTLTSHYGIPIEPKSFCGLPESSCIIAFPLNDVKYQWHIILWTGKEIHDPLQFKKLKITIDELTHNLEKVVIYA